jgi:hypothetical protein
MIRFLDSRLRRMTPTFVTPAKAGVQWPTGIDLSVILLDALRFLTRLCLIVERGSAKSPYHRFFYLIQTVHIIPAGP